VNKYKQNIPEGKTVFIGIDLHRNSWHMSAVVDDEIIFSGTLPADPEALMKFLRRYHRNTIRVVYEASCFGYWLYELLNDSGIECIVTPPTLVPMEYGNHVKTDKRDSRKLACLLSKGMLKKVWAPSPQLRAHRQALRRRQKLVSDRTRVKHRIKSELCFHGFTISYPQRSWSANFVARLKAIPIADPVQQQSFWILVEEYEYLNQLVEQQTDLLKILAASETYKDRVELLLTIPGIGPISAISLLLELGDVSRFARAEQLAAYVGLTPSQYSSGDKIRLGRITRCGKNSLRAVLTQAAWSAVRKSREFRKYYENLAYRRGSKKAIVAVARKLLLLSRIILLEDRPYYSQNAA
jgi:transposase